MKTHDGVKRINLSSFKGKGRRIRNKKLRKAGKAMVACQMAE